MEKFSNKAETYQIIGICMEVHRCLGYGFSEVVYKDAIEVEANSKGIPIDREKQYNVWYKKNVLKHKFCADFVMFDNIIVEIKSSEKGISNDHMRRR